MLGKPQLEKSDVPKNMKLLVDEKAVEQLLVDLAEEKKLPETEKKPAVAPTPLPAPSPVTENAGLFSSPARSEEVERVRKRTEERPRRDKGSAGERRRSLPKYSSKLRSEKKPQHRHTVVDGQTAGGYRTTHYSNPNSPFHVPR